MTLSRINHTGAAASTTLNGSITGAATSLTLTSATGYPAAPFIIKVDAGTASEEKILVGVRSGTGCSSLTRGYDGTTQTSHSSGAAVEHDLGANVVDDLNDHVYTISRDDHTQYLRVDGTRAGTGSQTIGGQLTVSSGGLTVTAGGATVSLGGLTVSAGTTAVQALTSTTLVASSTAQATAHISTLTGTNGRYVGTTSGAPSSGTFLTNDFANDPTNGVIWQCTAGGTPGTWVQLGGATDAAWTAPTLTNSWVNIGSGQANAGYRKANGRVYLRGFLISGAVGTSVFTLPVGYRPSTAMNLSYSFIASSVAYASTAVVGTDGTITVHWVGTPSTTTTILDGLSFDTL